MELVSLDDSFDFSVVLVMGKVKQIYFFHLILEIVLLGVVH